MPTATSLRALVIEDEPLAARRLTDLLRRQQPAVDVVATAESVAAAVALLDTLQPAPDVLFLDIHLADGLSFELFERTIVSCPVIFTTAYDQYAIRAFKVKRLIRSTATTANCACNCYPIFIASPGVRHKRL